MTREAGSVLSGDRVSIVAGNDLTVTGSAIVGDRDVNLRAGRDVDISAATETESHYLLEKKKKSGLLDSGGIGFTLGNQSSRHEADEHGVIQSQSASTIGSTQGNVTITAENRVHVRGADLVAGTDLDITGDSVRIDPGYDERTRHETFESKQRGLTIALSGTVGSALNTAVSAARQAGQESDGRLRALQGAKAALSGVQAAQALERDDLLTQAADAKNTAAGLSAGDKDAAQGATNTIGVNISYGSQSSKTETRSESRRAQGSTLNAGRDISITATGAGRGPTAAMSCWPAPGSRPAVTCCFRPTAILNCCRRGTSSASTAQAAATAAMSALASARAPGATASMYRPASMRAKAAKKDVG